MSSTYGEHLKLSIFGQSHGLGIGMTLDGIPAGLPVDIEALQRFLDRRAPGQSDLTTPRKEADRPEFIAGLVDGYTCGAPIAAVIHNTNTRSSDYHNLKDCPRPGHADLTAQLKYGGYQDASGGGHFSGRLTAPLCIAGGLCIQWLERMGISVTAKIEKINGQSDKAKMQEKILAAKANGDSVGGIICCTVTGLPAGLGEPMFGGMESRIAQIVYGIPAVKGLEFGNGFACAELLGSENNDPYTVVDGKIETVTNNCGGILGGITNGMPLTFRVAIKPTPSIAKPQQSISLSTMEETELTVHGRHDPCIVPRAVPVIEAAAAIAVYDALLMRR